MSYFLLKTYDKQQAESLSFLKHVSWNQYHSKFKINDIVFIYIIDEEIFKCAAKIVGIREKNKECHLVKLFDIKNSSTILSDKSKFPAMKSRCSNILLKDNNYELVNLLLKNKVM